MQNWCLYCSQLSLRREAVQKDFERHGLAMNWWHSIHAKSFGIKSAGFPPTDIIHAPHNPNCGQVGLTIGWWMLWQHLLLSEHPGPFLCFEDDAILCDDFSQKFGDASKALPEEWQFAFVGTTGHHPPQEMSYSDGPVVRCKTGLPGGTHALLIKKNALSTLLEHNHVCETLIDDQLSHTALHRLKCYAFKPSLVAQGSHVHTSNPRWCPPSAD